MRKKLFLLISLVLVIGLAAPASAGQLLASYEPGEFPDLTLGTPDVGLFLTPVLASNVGLTAPEGDYILQWAFGEADRKVEVSHTWSSFTYDLAGENYVLVDVFCATDVLPMTLTGIWSANWAPHDAWQQGDNEPTAVGEWITISFALNGRGQTGLSDINALLFEGMSADFGIIYTDNLRTSLVPEPATIALLGLGGLALLRRKR